MRYEKLEIADVSGEMAAKIIESAFSMESFSCPQLAERAGVSAPSARRVIAALEAAGYVSASESRQSRIYFSTERVLCAILTLGEESLGAKILARNGDEAASICYRINPSLEYEFGVGRFLEQISERIEELVGLGHTVGVCAVCKTPSALLCSRDIIEYFPHCVCLGTNDYAQEYVRTEYGDKRVLFVNADEYLSFALYTCGTCVAAPSQSKEIRAEEMSEKDLCELCAQRYFELRHIGYPDVVMINCEKGDARISEQMLTSFISKRCNLYGDDLPLVVIDEKWGIIGRCAYGTARRSLSRELAGIDDASI